MDCHKFLSCVVFHIENHGSMIEDEDRSVVANIVKIMRDWDDGKAYPRSGSYHDFLNWIDLTSDERYSSWVVGFFIENGRKVPFRERTLIEYIVKAHRAYVGVSERFLLDEVVGIPEKYYEKRHHDETVAPLFSILLCDGRWYSRECRGRYS